MSQASPSGREGPPPTPDASPIRWAFTCMISLALVAIIAGAARAAEMWPQSLLTGEPMAIDAETPTLTRTTTATRTASATATPTLDPAYSHTVTFRQGLEPSPDFMGCADATLVQYEPDYPHTPANIYLRPPDYIEKTGIQHWDLAAWIPAWSVVSSARLSLYAVYATNPGEITISLYPVRRPWVASWVTWNRPNDLQDVLWSVPGAKGIGSDTGPAAASFTLQGAGRWYSVDVTALAQKWVARPGNNNGVLLRVSGATAQTEYEVAGCQAPPALRAYLEMSYNDYYPGNTPTATSTPTTILPLPGTPTFTKTPRPTFTRTLTATFTATPSATVTTTGTATATPTVTPTATETATDTPTPKPTWTASVTATQTPAPIPSLILHFPLIVSDYAPGG